MQNQGKLAQALNSGYFDYKNRSKKHLSQVLKDDFRLPSKEEIANMITPEMYCAQAAMMAAEQRLRDAGYGEKYLHVPENADDSDDQQVMEDEVG